jgi:proteasome lid subunit RPN8/RPN11
MFAACKDLRRRDLVELAVYHSHPTSAPVPSRKDLARNFWPGVIHFIVSLTSEPPAVGGWWLFEDSYHLAEWSLIKDPQEVV